ncbi:MAG: lipo-like protein [Pseudomonadota bacterium]
MSGGIGDRIANWIADRLRTESSGYQPYTPSDFGTLCAVLQPGDVLLIEGNQKVSAAIKYLTQSTWSHAALYVGEALIDEKQSVEADPSRPRLIEVNLGEGCVAVPLSKYESYNTRICRPVNLSSDDRRKVVEFMIGKLGVEYDLRNILDLARYLFPTPPIPVRWRRRMIALGSGQPTRAICSTLIAQAFQSIRYPILPDAQRKGEEKAPANSAYSQREILHIRHHSLFTPRDFDLSPYFEIVKPTVQSGFDYRALEWAKTPD